VTLFVTLLAAYGALLARYSGQSRIVVGTAAANRNRIETEPLLGCFVNTLALPLDLAGDPGFGELLERVRRVVVGAYAHQDLPFEKLVEDLNPDRRSAQPLFQTFFLLQPRPPELRLAELTARPLQAESTGNRDAMFDLAMGVEDFPAGLFVAFSYNASLYPQPLVERMLADYRRILDRVGENLALRRGRWEDDVTAVRLSELPPGDGELSEVRRLFGAPADGPPADAATDVESARREVTELRAGLSRQLDKLPPALRERFEQRLRHGPAASAPSRPDSEGPSPT
jgi:non-ribosomal peptide synthetase component F